MENHSSVSEFVLVGFPGLPQKFDILISFVVFFVYNTALYANGIVIIVITLKAHLHQPMYIIIANLALSDILLDTMTLPKILAKYWFGDAKISFTACFFQLFFIHYLGSVDSFIIMLMAIDRYIAICKPLRYFSIISNGVTANVCGVFWLVSALIGLCVLVLGVKLPYCGPNIIMNYFCSFTPVVVLACADLNSTRKIVFIIAMFVNVIQLFVIIFSYVMIIRTICLTAGSENWHKAFYTCTTHLFVIGMYYGPRLIVYMYNQVHLMPSVDLNVLLIFLYTFVPHFTSPIIYCLRTEEIKKTLAKIFKKTVSVLCEG
ncbi:olfactory receptor 6B1-like, partial [Pelobates fuscus]|uniref:olfactory receptor 6B1-like n=1 Tax=Pelobates fuscus TaxID=191477 RepID=UPI002FE4CEBB